MSVVTTIERLGEHLDRSVTLEGWLYNRRSKGKIHFLQVRDGTGVVQAVMAIQDVDAAEFETARSLQQEASVRVTGRVRADDRAPGGVELTVESLEVLQAPDEPYPLGKKDHGPDFLLSHRHLWIRSRRQWAILRIRHEVIRAIRDHLDDQGFVCMDAPIFTPSACEGTTTLFGVDYFNLGKAYLTQSGQLYNEATAMAFGKVYCFGPTFRAERSKTRRHLTEFWMVEPEVAYAELDDVMDLCESFVTFIVSRVLERRRPELAVLERDLEPLRRVQPPFPRITYDDAVDIIQRTRPDFVRGDDFGAPDEAAVSAAFDRPVLVHRYPAAVKAFYMKPDPADAGRVLGVDVLAPEGYGEIIGGGERSVDLAHLRRQIRQHGLREEDFQWYLDLRRWGSVPHGGFGLGLERTVAWICGTEHIRETIPFPRMLYRIEP